MIQRMESGTTYLDELAPVEIHEAVRPFARLMSGPATILPSQQAFDSLRDLYEAREHDDFHLPRDYVAWQQPVRTSYYANLPFRLALDIHPAVYLPSSYVLKETFNEYSTAKSASQHCPDGAEAKCQYLEDRARALLIGAILTAATAGNVRDGKPEDALKRIYDEGYIGRRTYRRTHEVIGYARSGA